MASFRKAYLLKQRYSARMLRQRGIHGVGVGFKEPSKPHKGAALIVYADAISAASGKNRKGKSKPKALSLPAKLKAEIPVRIVRSTKFHKNSLLPHASVEEFDLSLPDTVWVLLMSREP